MKIIKITVSCILVCAMTLGGALVFAEAKAAFDSNATEDILNSTPAVGNDFENLVEEETNAAEEEIPVFPSETNSFAKDFLIGPTDQDAPFFEVVLPQIAKHIKEYNKHSVTKYYDALPVANNPENFQGLGSTTYANINGKTVTAEAFYRVHGDSLHDPNCGMGLLLYQCIQYKLKHPDEDVKVTFSSYRTSATASVCVLPESKYYGYMRSLYTTNYDEQGFVRISYMLVEAARMGIEVTMVNQLPSYAVSQYNPAKDKLESRMHIHFKDYFKAALKTECYNSYVGEGKKVSDYLNCVNVEWTINEHTQNMQHVKSLSASHYLATDGSEHTSALFMCTSNLDENNYKGCNGNGYSQSGVIISDHDELYRVNYNYNQLMAKYMHQEGLQELRALVTDMNNEQAALIKAGRGDEIPRDEQIIYLGTENDKVFELYFTPIGGSTDTWDTENNPICNYVSKLPESDDYIEFASNQYGFGKFYNGYMMQKIIEKAYCENPNPNNKIAIRITDFDVGAIKNLKIGKEIGYRSIKDSTKIHAKDYMISYSEGGQRHYVSILTSCNLYMIAFHYRTNSILVIHETDETGNGFYRALGPKFTSGMITEE